MQFFERVYANNVARKFKFLRSSSSQQHFHFSASISSENVSQVRTIECKTRSFFFTLNISSLCSSRHFNGDTTLAVIVSFLIESVDGFDKIRDERV